MPLLLLAMTAALGRSADGAGRPDDARRVAGDGRLRAALRQAGGGGQWRTPCNSPPRSPVRSLTAQCMGVASHSRDRCILSPPPPAARAALSLPHRLPAQQARAACDSPAYSPDVAHRAPFRGRYSH